MDLRKLDLNLLRVLNVLMREKNTRKTAEILQTSQSAVSRSLGRLREELGDPLFVRHKQGLKLTARAEVLARSLPKIFSDLQVALEGEVFDPSTLSGKFRIALNGFFMDLYGSKIFEALKQHCPNLTVELFSYDSETNSKLASDDIEIGLTFGMVKISKDLYSKEIGRFNFAILSQKGLFPDNSSMTVEECTSYPIAGLILPEINNEGVRIQKQIATPINVVLRSQQLSPILESMLKEPMLLPIPEMFFDKVDSQKYQLVKLKPGKHKIIESIDLIYNSKYWNSPKYHWLENLLQEIVVN